MKMSFEENIGINCLQCRRNKVWFWIVPPGNHTSDTDRMIGIDPQLKWLSPARILVSKFYKFQVMNPIYPTAYP
ncbi:hypothetical protein LIER_18103 [Lithospermum erythrorhizon]|uniref:Uncharacterized protein n=1 Tax=Lithospermum erythrorhizon TaxID=34254 RepID=A0AAV3QDT2_LITER